MGKRFRGELAELNVAGVIATACGFGVIGLLFFFFSVNFFIYSIMLLPLGAVSLFALMLIVLVYHLLLGGAAGILFFSRCGGLRWRALPCCGLLLGALLCSCIWYAVFFKALAFFAGLLLLLLSFSCAVIAFWKAKKSNLLVSCLLLLSCLPMLYLLWFATGLCFLN